MTTSHADTGQTPLDPNEIEGMIPTHLATRTELDRWEHDNIVDALDWLDRFHSQAILEESFLRELHRRMFSNTWRWAGTFRQSEKNIGIPFHQIPIQLRQLLDDVKFWIEHDSYAPDEIAVRLHHSLVLIHPFPNGNGRHARLITDLVLERVFLRQAFTWGQRIHSAGNARKPYIEALQAADEQDFDPLMAFVRS